MLALRADDWENAFADPPRIGKGGKQHGAMLPILCVRVEKGPNA